ncbi:MAG: hypothetical protein AB2L20_15010 [Mangrovibacterium sp.]
MIFNAGIESDQIRAKERLIWLVKNKKRFEITELRRNRTDRQNKYLHLILSYFALEVGETLEFIKQETFKKTINPDIFKSERINPKSGKKRECWKSTSEIDTKEMSVCIDRFRNWALQKTGIYIPQAHENEFLDHIQNEIEMQKQWL